MPPRYGIKNIALQSLFFRKDNEGWDIQMISEKKEWKADADSKDFYQN